MQRPLVFALPEGSNTSSRAAIVLDIHQMQSDSAVSDRSF